jgi:hypothetical protein
VLKPFYKLNLTNLTFNEIGLKTIELSSKTSCIGLYNQGDN